MDTQKLRQRILDLAIRGKLVPQDPNDEPASVLLEKIRAEKERLIKEGKIKKPKTKKTSDKSHYEAFTPPFQIPDSWEWVTLDDLAFYKKGPFGSSLTKSMFVPNGKNVFKVFEQKNAIQKDGSLGNYYISSEKFEELRSFEVYPNDIIVSCAGTIGETFVLPNDIQRGIINQALMIIRLYDASIQRFYLEYFDFVLKNNAVNEGKGTAIKNIPPFDVLKSYPFPLPPIDEQNRIVKKLDNYFELIRFIDDSRHMLFTTISNAKSKILELAMQGKLVPQNPADEPAADMLWRINPKAKIITDNPHSWNVPTNWAICKLGDTVKIRSAKRVMKSDWRTAGVPFYRTREIVKLSENGTVENELFISDQLYDDYREKYGIPIVGDIMITAVGTIGKTYIVRDNDKFYYKDASVLCITPYSTISSEFLTYLFKAECLKKQLLGNSKGTTVDTITIEKANSYIIAIPPLNEQERIVAKIEELYSTLDEIEASLRS